MLPNVAFRHGNRSFTVSVSGKKEFDFSLDIFSPSVSPKNNTLHWKLTSSSFTYRNNMGWVTMRMEDYNNNN